MVPKFLSCAVEATGKFQPEVKASLCILAAKGKLPVRQPLRPAPTPSCMDPGTVLIFPFNSGRA